MSEKTYSLLVILCGLAFALAAWAQSYRSPQPPTQAEIYAAEAARHFDTSISIGALFK